MNKLTYTLLSSLCAAAALFSGFSAMAQSASLTGSGYTQNFSSMGTGTTVSVGWSGVSEAGTHYTFAPNVTNEYNDSMPFVNENFTAGALTASTVEALTPTQASSTGKGTDIVNWANSAADIAAGEGTESLGTDPSGNAGTILELSLTNNTGVAITSLQLSYDVDRFTTISDTQGNPAGFANSSVEEFPGYHLFYNLTPSNNSTWVEVSSLDPTVNMGTTGAVTDPNTVGITVVPSTFVSLGGSVANGSTFALAWFDDNASAPSPDQEIGLNEIDIQGTPEPRSAALGFLAMCGMLGLVLHRRRSVN
jgi:hypothetical protein